MVRGRADGDLAEKVSVSVYGVDQALVRHVQERYYFPKFSQALRFILRDWARAHDVDMAALLEAERAE